MAGGVRPSEPEPEPEVEVEPVMDGSQLAQDLPLSDGGSGSDEGGDGGRSVRLLENRSLPREGLPAEDWMVSPARRELKKTHLRARRHSRETPKTTSMKQTKTSLAEAPAIASGGGSVDGGSVDGGSDDGARERRQSREAFNELPDCPGDLFDHLQESTSEEEEGAEGRRGAGDGAAAPPGTAEQPPTERQLDFPLHEPKPEPELDPEMPLAEVRERIVEIYSVHNPRKLDGDLDLLLGEENEWVGEEYELLCAIQKKYLGPQASLHRRLAVARQRLAWGKVCNVFKTLRRDGEYAALLPALGSRVAHFLLIANVQASHNVAANNVAALQHQALMLLTPEKDAAAESEEEAQGDLLDLPLYEPERFLEIPEHSEEHTDWLVKPNAVIQKTAEQEESEWVPPSAEAATRRHALNPQVTKFLAVLASMDLIVAFLGWAAITQCEDDDGFPTNVFCWWTPPKFSLESFAGNDSLQYYSFTTSLIDVLILCWGRNFVVLGVVWARNRGRKRGKQTLHLSVSSDDARLGPLFVDPNRLFETDAGSTTMTLTVCTVPELEEKIQKELGLRRSHSIKVLWTDPMLGFTDELWSLEELPTFVPKPLKYLLGSEKDEAAVGPPEGAGLADIAIALREPGEVLGNDRSGGRVAPWAIVWKVVAGLVILCFTVLILKVAQRAMYAHSSEWTASLVVMVGMAVGGNALVGTLLLTLSHLEQRRRNSVRKERMLVLAIVIECVGVWLTWTSVTHCKTYTEEGTVASSSFFCWFEGPKIDLTWSAPEASGQVGGASADIAWLGALRFIMFVYMCCKSDNINPVGWWGWRLASGLTFLTVGAIMVEAGATVCEWGIAPPVVYTAGSSDEEFGSWEQQPVAGFRPKSSPWLKFVPRMDTCKLIPVDQIILLSGGILFGLAEGKVARGRHKTLKRRHKAASRVAPEDIVDLMRGPPPGPWDSFKLWVVVTLAGPTNRETVEEGDRFFEQQAYSKACAKYMEAIERSADGLYCSELYQRMGWAGLLRGDDRDAKKMFEQAVKYNGLCIHSRYNLATMLLNENDPESTLAAETHLRKALSPNASVTGGASQKEQDSLSAKVSVNLSCVLSSQGQVKEASAVLRQVLYKTPNHKLAITNLALLLLNSSSAELDPDENPDEEEPPEAEGEETKGTLGASGVIEESCALLRRLCILYPGNPEVHHCLAAALHRQALAIEPISDAAHEHTEGVKRTLIDEAIEHYTKCANLQEGYGRTSAKDTRGGRYKAGSYAGQLRAGTVSTGWQVGVWERNEEASHGRAAVLASLGLAVAARHAPGWKGRTVFCHKTALQLYPDYLVPSLELAQLMEPGSHAQEMQLRHVLSLDPAHALANNLMARAHSKRGEREQASQYYEHAAEESDMAASARLPSVDHAIISQLTFRGGGSTSSYGARRPSSAMAERYAVADEVSSAPKLPEALQPPKRPYSARPSIRKVAQQEEEAAAAAAAPTTTEMNEWRRKAAEDRGEVVKQESMLMQMFAVGVDSRNKLPDGWYVHISESSGRTVFVNSATGAQQYETPTEPVVRPQSATAHPDYTIDGYGGAHPAGYDSGVFVKGRPLSAAAKTSVHQSERSGAEMAAQAARPHSAGHLRHDAIPVHSSPVNLGYMNEQSYKLPRRPLPAELLPHGRKEGVIKATTEERIRQLKVEAGAGFRGRALWARDSHSIGLGSPGPVHSPPPPGARLTLPPLPQEEGIVNIYSGSPQHTPPRGASPPGVSSRPTSVASARPGSAGSGYNMVLTATSPELTRFTAAETATLGTQRVSQTVAPAGKRQPAASYPALPDAAGGKVPEDETWDPSGGNRNAFLIRDEAQAEAGWVNPNNENAPPDPTRTQFMAMKMPHENSAGMRNELYLKRRPASASPAPTATHAHRATPPSMVSRPSSAAANRAATRTDSLDVRPSSAKTDIAVGGVSFPVSHVETISTILRDAGK